MFRKAALAIAAASIAAVVPLIGSVGVADAVTVSPRSNSLHSGIGVAPDKIFALKNKEANECLDSNAELFIYSCNNSRVQKWGFTNAGGGKVSLYSEEAEKCITNSFRFVDCANRDVAKFTLENVNLNYNFIKIRNAATGRCLATAWRPEWARWGVGSATCSGSHNQLWIKQ
ncbi:RICIN domain-containing protein [Streptomyces sp. NPDC102264]|uniref:RICIN domain-containing protein n=1 Tax=Streptomyces sp. NPDC102264 TaxID=3366149 RepID=UPI003828A16B